MTTKEGQAKQDGFAVPPKALGSVVIGQPGVTQSLDQRRKIGGGVHVANKNSEAVAVQMAGAKLVAVATHFEKADAMALDVIESVFRRDRHGNHLPGERVAIFHAGSSDFA